MLRDPSKTTDAIDSKIREGARFKGGMHAFFGRREGELQKTLKIVHELLTPKVEATVDAPQIPTL